MFSPPAAPADPESYRPYVERLREWADARGLPIGEPSFSDDHYAEKIELLLERRVAVVSFTFGCPDPALVERLHGAGSEVWVTITTPHEAAIAVSAGADVLVAQGIEAGGHRGSFSDEDDAATYSLLPLIQLVSVATECPLVATGGIASGRGIAAVLGAGARAAQLGTAFLRCPEAGTSQAHRAALGEAAPTELTRAFTGRTARGIRNAFMDEHGAAAPAAYPEIHYVTQPLRRAGREAGDASLLNLWAGEGYTMTKQLPAADLVRELAADLRAGGASPP